MERVRSLPRRWSVAVMPAETNGVPSAAKRCSDWAGGCPASGEPSASYEMPVYCAPVPGATSVTS